MTILGSVGYTFSINNYAIKGGRHGLEVRARHGNPGVRASNPVESQFFIARIKILII